MTSGAESTGTPPLGRKMAAGAAWMMLFKLIDRAVGMTSLLILARLLVPADFGLVAMATAVVALLELLSAFGFDVALIAHRNPGREQYDTAWTFNVIASAGISVLMLLLAYPVARFYGEPRLSGIISVLAVAAAVQGWENIGPVAFRRELAFRREFVFLLLKRLGAAVVVIPAAFILRNYWALVCGILAGRILAVATSYWIHPYRPRLTLVARHELFRFSRWMLINNLVSFIKERSPDFVIGRTLGPASVGLYNMGAEIANMPTAELSAPLNRALLPGYALASRGSALAHTYLTTLGTLALFVIPAGFGLLSLADPIVKLLLGEKWSAAVPVLATMSLHGVITALQSLGYTLMIASSRPEIPARLNSIHVSVLLVLLVWLSSRNGLPGAAAAYLGTAVVMAPVMLFFVTSLLGISLGQVGRAIWRPVVAALAMTAVLWSWHPHAFGAGITTVTGLLLSALGGAVIYMIVLIGLWFVSGRPAGAEQTCLNMLRARIPRAA